MMGTVVCDYKTADDPVLLLDTTTKCYTATHIGLVAAAVVGLLAYYPLASLIYPNLQFSDPAVDVKFSTEWLVGLQQGKLVIAAATAFLVHDLGAFLIVLCVVLVCLGTSVAVMQPCFVQRVNIWRSASYFAAAAAAVATLAVDAGVDGLAALVCLVVAWAAVAATAAVVHRRRFGFHCCRCADGAARKHAVGTATGPAAV